MIRIARPEERFGLIPEAMKTKISMHTLSAGRLRMPVDGIVAVSFKAD